MNDGLPRVLCACLFLALGAACASSREPLPSAVPQDGAGAPSGLETVGQSEYVLSDDVSVRRLAPGVWVHTTLGSEAYGRYPANGLVIEDGEEALLVDAGWNPQQAERLLTWAREELRRPVRAAVVTHFHNDRTGGAKALTERGLPVYGLEETARLATTRGELAPSHTFAQVQQLGPIELFFPGAGHSQDNIVVWHRGSGVLFGGCFVKDAAAKNLGNVADADTSAWPASLERTRARFSQVRIVVPGHGLPGGRELLVHTQELLRAPAAPR
ncbi:subclass B1 metallo-beta-lactamase [Hyalangium sp.]|uniref:subclass B1 metallo-beta-lactamase n=1 Tax=Hyalangium sp. TaxID=2028555 RepID=UPI002D488D1D|nr:subclass B1 metallo-beta-lactamase [Hyalangium sp.]HYI00867.1 subclass B1 metallo-beta-lactamase [Hyalangium sp.]